MQNPVKIHAITMQKLKEIDGMHGALTPFLQKTFLHYRTFKRILEKGFAQADVVGRIEDAVRDKEGTPAFMVTHVKECFARYVLELEGKKVKSADERNRNAELISSLNKMVRLVCAFTLWKKTRLDVIQIAKLTGYTHKTGVNKAVDRIYEKMETDPVFRRYVWNCIGSL